MTKHECKYSDSIENLKSDIHEIKKDVKSLLAFKWQVLSGAGIIGFILSLAVSLFVNK